MAIGNRGLIHYFHADANALGATIQRHEDKPFSDRFAGSPSASLPPVGGHITQDSGIVRFPQSPTIPNILSADATNCEVHGDFDAGYPTTRALAQVKGLAVVERLKAASVVAQITTKHPAQGLGDVPRVEFGGTEIQRLTIDGKISIEVILNLHLLALEDGEKCLRIPHLRDERLWKQVCRQYDHEAGSLLCTLVKDIKGADGKVVKRISQNALEVDNLGKIFFAELLVQYYSFRLTMIRVELGCPTVGDTSTAVAMANGKPSGP
jgi:hypothetical protein